MKMNKFYGALALLCLAMSVSMCSPAVDDNTQACDNCDAVIDNIMTRTSIRAYTDSSVSDTMITTMLKAAMAAPTAVNKQPWRFIVIKERATLDSLAANIRGMRMADKAPLAIAVCGDLAAAMPGDAQPFWIQDASAATENLLLAAHALKLGAVWCGVTPMADNMAYVSRLLALPDSIVPLNVVIIGHPAESPEPKDKWNPDNIHYERW